MATTSVTEIADSAVRRGDLQESVQPILESLAATLGYDKAFVVLFDADRETVQNVIGINVPRNFIEALQASSAKPFTLMQALSQGRPIRVDDVGHDPRITDALRPLYVEAGITSFAAIPLLPVSWTLVVSKARPVTEAEINDLFPHAGQLAAALWERHEQRQWKESNRQQAGENDWLWRMMDSVTDPVILTDEENNILLQNVHAERLFKASPTDGAGKRRAIELNNFLTSAALSSYVLDQSASALGRELTLVDPVEGGELLCEIICRSVTSPRTGKRGLVTVIKDVTGLRETGEELRRSMREVHRASEEVRQERDRLQMILENVAEPIVVAGLSNDIILMNPPAERLLRAPYEHRERSSRSLANETKLTAFLLQLSLDTADTLSGELQFLDPLNNLPLAMSITATKVRDGTGQVIAHVCVLHDLTQMRELEGRRLEQQLFESEKLAAVGRLAATIAHEINNPLEAIKNAVYAVVSHVPEDQADYKLLDIARKETERVSRIIRQMLGLYRGDTAKTFLDINILIDEALLLLRGELKRHGIKLRTDLDGGVPPVLAVSDQLKQVFLNLFINAQEAMEKGGELSVTTRMSKLGDAELLPGRYVLVEVQDTGPGIAEENLHRIFDPFFSTKRERKGTGLGLWVSMDIAQRHGGQLKVRTRLGKGTTFTLALPVGNE